MRILSLCAVLFFVISLAVPAFASSLLVNVIDPYNYASSVTVDGSNEIVNVSLPVDDIFWRRYHNDSLSYSGIGPIFEYNTQVRYIDNDQIFCHYFGESNVISTSGIPSGVSISGTSRMNISVKKDGVLYDGQTYDTVITSYCYLYDSDGVVQKQLTLGSQSTADLNGFAVKIDWTLPTDELSGFSYFAVFMLVDLNGIADEDDTTTVSIDARGNLINFAIPFNQLAQLKDQGERTNQLLEEIDSVMQENGQKLDDVISEQQDTNNKLDDIMNNTVPPDTPTGSDKVDDLDDAEAGLRDDSADGLNQGLDVLDSTLDALLTYSFAFYALGSIFNLFFNIPFFNALVYFAFALGILASILGIIKESSSAFGSGSSRGKYSKQNVKARNREKS